jgi:hypothetical protein
MKIVLIILAYYLVQSEDFTKTRINLDRAIVKGRRSADSRAEKVSHVSLAERAIPANSYIVTPRGAGNARYGDLSPNSVPSPSRIN